MQRERYITNTVFLFGTSLIAQIVSFFVLPLFIANLGTEIYGLFVISNLLLGYVGLLDFGFTTGLMRQIGQAHASDDRDALSHAVSTGFWLLVWVGCAAAALIYFGREVIMDFLKLQGADRVVAARILTVTAGFSLIQWPLRLPATILKATLHIKAQSIIAGATAMLSSLTMLALVLLSVNVVSILLGVYGVSTLGSIAMIVLIRRSLPQVSWRLLAFHRPTFRNMSRFSLGMFYRRVLGLLAVRVDQLIIGNMLGVGYIVFYVIAHKPFEIIRRYASYLFGPLMPTVFNLDIQKDRGRLQTLLETSSRYRSLLVTPSAYTAILVSPALVRLWMGEDFAHAGFWAQVYLLFFLRAHLSVAPMIAQGIGQLRLCNMLSTISMVINLTVSILTVPRFGYGGPILGTVLAAFVMDDVTFYLVSKNCGLRWRRAYALGFAIVGCNLPAALAFYFFFPKELLLSWPALFTATVVLLCVFYGTAMLLFVGEEQIKDFRIALRSVGLERVKPIYMLLKLLLKLHRSLRHILRIERRPAECAAGGTATRC